MRTTTASAGPAVRIGISGWTYAPWRGTFFPKKLPHRAELAYAASQVPSIEINGTFYSLQRPTSFRKWFNETPEEFLFSVKGPRFITHLKRLRECAIPLANFFASGVLSLGEKLGPILWQLPPNFAYDRTRLENFFALLPRTTTAALKLARRHDGKVKFASLEQVPARPLRYALEIRHESFRTAEFIALLRAHGVALVVADTAGKWPLIEEVTTDFIYVRLHGDAQLYVSGYTPEALDAWAAKIRTWRAGGNVVPSKQLLGRPLPVRAREVYVYFDNDVKTHAPYDAMNLAYRLGLAPAPLPGVPVLAENEVPRPRWPSYPASRKRRTAAAPSSPS